MDIEKEKNEIYKNLEELEKEIEVLKGNIKEYRTCLESVKTEEDITKFCNECDLEKGLRSIRLF